MFTAVISEQLGKTQRKFEHATSKVVCVGRNYIEHAKELNNPVPKSPLLFIKSSYSLVTLSPEITIPKPDLRSNLNSTCHHELEIALLIGKRLTRANASESMYSIVGVGVGLDLTLRELQTELKSKGHPWEKAKAFDGACPVSEFITYDHAALNDSISDSRIDLNDLNFSMLKNQETAQEGNTKDMIFPIDQLLAEISNHFTLLPGDIVMTGTPPGVSSLNKGDQLSFYLGGQHWCDSVVCLQAEGIEP